MYQATMPRARWNSLVRSALSLGNLGILGSLKIDDTAVLRQLLLKAVHASDLDEFRRMIPNGTT
jgi:hypothetical protein